MTLIESDTLFDHIIRCNGNTYFTQWEGAYGTYYLQLWKKVGNSIQTVGSSQSATTISGGTGGPWTYYFPVSLANNKILFYSANIVGSTWLMSWALFDCTNDTWGSWSDVGITVGHTDVTHAMMMKTDGNGYIHLVYDDATSSMGGHIGVVAYRYWNGSTWSAKEQVNVTALQGSAYFGFEVMGSTPDICVVWDSSNAADTTHYRVKTGGTWGSETDETNATGSGVVCAHGSAWTRLTSNGNLMTYYYVKNNVNWYQIWNDHGYYTFVLANGHVSFIAPNSTTGYPYYSYHGTSWGSFTQKFDFICTFIRGQYQEFGQTDDNIQRLIYIRHDDAAHCYYWDDVATYTSSSSKGAFTRGQTDATPSSVPAFLDCSYIRTSIPAYTNGYIANESAQFAYLKGWAHPTTNKPAYMFGVILARGDQHCFMYGDANMALDVVPFILNDKTGNQDITGSLGGLTPDVALFFGFKATGHDAAREDDIGWFMGFCNGTSQRLRTGYVLNGSTSNGTNNTFTDGCAGLYSGSGGKAAFSQWLTNGVRLNYSAGAGGAYRAMALLLAGVNDGDIESYIGNFTISSPEADEETDITAPGFKPNLIIFFEPNPIGYAGISVASGVFGIAGDDEFLGRIFNGVAISQWKAKNNPGAGGAVTHWDTYWLEWYEGAVCANTMAGYPEYETRMLRVSEMLSNGFTIKAVDGGGYDITLHYIAIKIPAPFRFFSGLTDMYDQQPRGPGGVIQMVGSAYATNNACYPDHDGGGFGMGMAKPGSPIIQWAGYGGFDVELPADPNDCSDAWSDADIICNEPKFDYNVAHIDSISNGKITLHYTYTTPNMSFLWGITKGTPGRSSTLAYLCGSLNATPSLVHAYLNGAVPASSKPAYTMGAASALSNKPVYLVGGIISTSSKPTYMATIGQGVSNQKCFVDCGAGTVVSSKPAYLFGESSTTSNLPAYTHGKSDDLSSITAFVYGHIFVSASSPAYLEGILGGNSSIHAYLNSEVNSSAPAYLCGDDHVADSAPAYIFGQVEVSSSVHVFMPTGSGQGVSFVHAYARAAVFWIIGDWEPTP